MEIQNISPLSNNLSMQSPVNISSDGNSTKVSSESTKEYVCPESAHIKKLRASTQRGRIELIMGPMFAGKSTELLRRVNRLEISGKRCLSIKYAADIRYSNDAIATHDQ